MTRRGRLFKVHNRTGSLSGREGPANPITRTDLFWLAHVTQQKPGRHLIHFRRELKRRTCSRQQMRLPRQIIVRSLVRSYRGGPSLPARTRPVTCCNTPENRFITFHNVFCHTHLRATLTSAVQINFSLIESRRLERQLYYFDKNMFGIYNYNDIQNNCYKLYGLGNHIF